MRFFGSLMLLVCILCSSGCGVLMGAVVAPLYYYKEEVMKPKTMVQLEAKRLKDKEEELEETR